MADPSAATPPPQPAGSPANAIHMVRTTQQVHYQLSQMADQKASILMGATFLVFTVTVGQSRGGAAPVPLLILGGFAFVSAVLAVLAVLPATGPRTDAPVNLLFFGSFSQLSQTDYADRLLSAMRTDETIFRTMAADIWQNGQVLQRKKYRLLGYAYRMFLLGLFVSLAAFVLIALHI